MKTNTKMAIKYLVSGSGGERSNALANLLIDTEDDTTLEAIASVFRGRYVQDPEDVAHCIVGITIFDPSWAEKWFLEVGASDEAFGSRTVAYGFVFGIINSVRWLCEQNLFDHSTNAGTVIHACLISDNLMMDGTQYYERKEIQAWDQRLSDMLTAIVELAKKNEALRETLTDLLNRCGENLKNSGESMSGFTKWFINDLHYKIFASIDYENRSAMLAGYGVYHLAQLSKQTEHED